MLCPHCKIPLSMADRKGIEIDYCTQCRGVWLDRGELDKIIELSAAERMPISRGDHRHHHDEPRRHAPSPSHSPYKQYKEKSYDKYGNKHGYPYKKKKKGFLREVFDFID